MPLETDITEAFLARLLAAAGARCSAQGALLHSGNSSPCKTGHKQQPVDTRQQRSAAELSWSLPLRLRRGFWPLPAACCPAGKPCLLFET